MPGTIVGLAAAVLAVSPALPTRISVPAGVASHVLTAPAIDSSLGVTFAVSTCFWDPPPSGLLPLRFDVRNDGRRAREWTAAFSSSSGYPRYGLSYGSSHVVSVAAGATRTLDLLVPVHAGPSSAGLPNSLQIALDGPGTSDGPASLFMNNYYLHSGTGFRAHSPWVGLSESLAIAHWEPTKTLLGTRDSMLLVGSRFEPGCLPADWRSYVGFTALALTADEWRDLPPRAHEATLRWVARGGRLWLAGGPALPRRLGFGRIEALPSKEALSAPALADAIVGLSAPPGDYLAWSLASRLGTPPFPKGLMLTFIASFALLVGPLNLFAFCRGPNRHRIVWTTPLLSTAASLGIGAAILFQDGTGGRGRRLAVVGLLPDRHEEVVIQEQLARTGLLLRSRFTTPESVWMEPLDTTSDASGGMRSLQLVRVGDVFSGDWFVSRALQGQLVEVIRPSRARLSLEEGAGKPVRLVSTVPDTLAHVYYIDAAGRFWHAAGVDPGRKVELAPALEEELDRWWNETTAHHGPRLRLAVTRAPGTIFATAPGSGAVIPTLGSVDWTDEPTLYVQRTRE